MPRHPILEGKLEKVYMAVNKVCSAFGFSGLLGSPACFCRERHTKRWLSTSPHCHTQGSWNCFKGRVTRNASFRLLRIVTFQEVESVFEGRVTRNASFRLLPPLGFYNIKRAGRKSKAWFCLQYATSSNIVLGPWAQTGRQRRIPIRAQPWKESPD